jgi:hypothetical protein
MENYATKTEAIIDLQKRGYDQDFILKSEGILCIQRNELIKPEEFEITATYRFVGKRRLCDNYIIYAIRAAENDIRGILMTSFRGFENNISIHLWAKLAGGLQN